MTHPAHRVVPQPTPVDEHGLPAEPPLRAAFLNYLMIPTTWDKNTGRAVERTDPLADILRRRALVEPQVSEVVYGHLTRGQQGFLSRLADGRPNWRDKNLLDEYKLKGGEDLQAFARKLLGARDAAQGWSAVAERLLAAIGDEPEAA